MDFAKVEPTLCLWASTLKKLANHPPKYLPRQSYSIFTVYYSIFSSYERRTVNDFFFLESEKKLNAFLLEKMTIKNNKIP